MNKRRFRTSDEVFFEYYTKHPKEIEGYLAVALEEYQKDGDEKAFLEALSFATKVLGGFVKLSKATGLNRENLYRALSKRSDPRFSTVMQVLDTLGFLLMIRKKNYRKIIISRLKRSMSLAERIKALKDLKKGRAQWRTENKPSQPSKPLK